MTSADIESVLALEQLTPEAPHWFRRDYENIVGPQPPAQLEGPPLTRAALIVELDDRIAGFAVVRQLRLPPTQAHFELESIVVAAPQRGKGIGMHLMNALFDLAIASGADRLELEVRASNRAAIRLYTRAGLTIQGLRPRYYSDPEENAVLMEIKIPPFEGKPPAGQHPPVPWSTSQKPKAIFR